MKYLILEGAFDPISEKELAYAKKLRKEYGAELLFFLPNEEGTIPAEERLYLLKKVTMPFRKLAYGTKESLRYLLEDKDTKVLRIKDEAEEEKKIREGEYRKAAQGIRATLAREGLYFKETVLARCSAHRASHSFSVAEVAMHLAEVHHLDASQAYFAGLLHDITKALPKEESKKILEIYDPGQLLYAEPVWHSFTAPVLLKRDLGIRDKKMLNAIYHHTLGDGRSNLSMILYIADKIEPTRGYDNTIYMQASEENLKKGCDMVKDASLRYRTKKGEV